MWISNLDHLAEHYRVIAIDLLGFGRSSRPRFKGKSADDGEEFFLRSIEDWREVMGLEQFTLLGHSFGGYLSAAYALKFPHRIDKLVLCDPWGGERFF